MPLVAKESELLAAAERPVVSVTTRDGRDSIPRCRTDSWTQYRHACRDPAMVTAAVWQDVRHQHLRRFHADCQGFGGILLLPTSACSTICSAASFASELCFSSRSCIRDFHAGCLRSPPKAEMSGVLPQCKHRKGSSSSPPSSAGLAQSETFDLVIPSNDIVVLKTQHVGQDPYTSCFEL